VLYRESFLLHSCIHVFSIVYVVLYLEAESLSSGFIYILVLDLVPYILRFLVYGIYFSPICRVSTLIV